MQKERLKEVNAELKKLSGKLHRFKGTEIRSYQIQSKKVTYTSNMISRRKIGDEENLGL